MPLRDLLVHLDASKHLAARMALAARLAKRTGAHLTGLYVTPRVEVPPFLADQYAPADLDEVYATIASKRDETQEAFAAATKAAGCEAEWLQRIGDAETVLTAEGRLADLAILGQDDPEERIDGIPRALPEHVALAIGRPVLMVPYAGSFATLGERVLVAWNDSPQAARALNDALPLMTEAKTVSVLEIDPPPGDEESESDIGRHLRRHGIAAEIDRISGAGIDTADLLLSRAADVSADLIVMGVYGHSRRREIILGGVSRHIFRHMTVPVLMSH